MIATFNKPRKNIIVFTNTDNYIHPSLENVGTICYLTLYKCYFHVYVTFYMLNKRLFIEKYLT